MIPGVNSQYTGSYFTEERRSRAEEMKQEEENKAREKDRVSTLDDIRAKVLTLVLPGEISASICKDKLF